MSATYRENGATPRQRHHSASQGQHAVCGFGLGPVATATTITITTVDGEQVLVVRDLTSRQTGEALRVFRQLFPKDEGYVYAMDARVAPSVTAGGDAA